MTAQTRSAVVGVFRSQDKADAAVSELYNAGFTYDQIGLVARTDTGSGEWQQLSEYEETATEEGAVAGAAVGAGVGGLWALGIAFGAVPAIGPAIAGGILVSLLASTALGAATGGVIGALVGLGVPEEDATYYEQEFRSGRVLLTVRDNDAARIGEARAIMLSHGAEGVDGRVMTTTS